MDKAPTIFVDGMFCEKGNQDFVKAKLNLNVEKLTVWLKTHQNAQGYVNIDILESRAGDKIYAKLNDWVAPVKPDFHTSPDENGDRINMAKHPLNSPEEQKEYDRNLKDWE